MKYFIFSDIHGSATFCQMAINQFYKKNCDLIICLGDVLYHGPRNPLPEGYHSQNLCNILNPLSDKIINVRGNCDSEVCEMVLNFPIMSQYNLIVDGKRKIFATHGHIYSPADTNGEPSVKGSKLPQPFGWDIFLYGHTHIPVLYKDAQNRVICNPGSISLPKANFPKSYAIYDGESIKIYDLVEDNILKELII